ncbi:PEP/pyruvate-binding domain-containing protein [Streptomyces sp. NPDC048191]|uniref:PEP/pyruvate-binding domain-containing protein n=1 Tax=Streptomyces sp. NPDC048191 TaxID=3155484 RepID=UPI003401AE6C
MSSVLYVYAFGGPPLDHTLARAAAHADVHVLALGELPQAYRDLPMPDCASLVQVAHVPDGDDLVEIIVRHAREAACDAVFTLSECAVVAVARACRILGLAGAGPRVEAAHNRHMMRSVWHTAGVPTPAFAAVDDEADVRDAFASLRPPLLLTPAAGPTTGAQVTVCTVEEALEALRQGAARVCRPARHGHTEPGGAHPDEGDRFLLEEVVASTSKGWFKQPGWGDEVSVEGIVAGGTYHPLCVNATLPAPASHARPSSVTPAGLAEILQRKIEKTARKAVDALRLDTCATHTTLTLGPDGALWVTGIAACFGPMLTARQAEDVFGMDMTGMLVRQLLGETVAYPRRMPTRGKGAAACLALGPWCEKRPQTKAQTWDFAALPWPALLSHTSTIEPVPQPSAPHTYPLPAHDGPAAEDTWPAVCYLTARDPHTLLNDYRRIMRETGSRLPQARRTQPASHTDALDLPRFRQLCGILQGRPYVKVVVDREQQQWHILDSTEYALHSPYIAERILGTAWADVQADLDAFSHSLYHDPGRRFLLGTLCLHDKAADMNAEQRPFLVLETLASDTMGRDLLSEFYTFIRTRLDASLPLFLKPANHGQEAALADVPDDEIARIAWHQLYTDIDYAALNTGEATGRLRYFASQEEYRTAIKHGRIEDYDILAMPVIPDGIPHVAGLISSLPTTPLSHANILAAGWDIPNAVIRDIADRITTDHLDNTWVHYTVTDDCAELTRAEKPAGRRTPAHPPRHVLIGTPRMEHLHAAPLSQLRADDRSAYGTKAAHLGELHHVLTAGSPHLTGFYTQPRAPHAHLLDHLAQRLGAPPHTSETELAHHARALLSRTISTPEGIALPFAWQERFLAHSPAIQQRIGKLKMALELEALHTIDTLCAQLQILIRHTPLPNDMLRDLRDITQRHLPNNAPLIVRSSSNAEDLPGFCAAGLYESVPHVTGEAQLADAVRRVWASLFSPRSVRLRHHAAIDPTHTYMGVLIHRHHQAAYGGVMATCNTTQPDDYRHVTIHLTPGSPQHVVSGSALPIQHLYNTIEGGGHTTHLGDADHDVDTNIKKHLTTLALAGRLLQGHFHAGPTHTQTLDIEWLLTPTHQLHLLQIRPFAA